MHEIDNQLAAAGNNKLYLPIITLIFLSTLLLPAFAVPSFMEALSKDGVGVRQLGMGGAATAVADDPSAMFYNPAGLGNQFFALSKNYLDLNKVNSPINESSFFAFRGVGVGFWQRTLPDQTHGEIYSYSYAKEGDDTTWGITYKQLIGNLPSGLTNGYSVDLGLLGKSGPARWGVLFADIYKNTGIPASIRAGLSSNNFLGSMLLAADLEVRDPKALGGPTLYGHVGAEKQVTDSLILRAGFNADRFTGGFSLNFDPISLDYALLTSPNSQSESVQLFGIRYGK